MNVAEKPLSAQRAEAINHHHRLAMASAADAVNHARAAGDLLMKMKDALKHGEFLPWLATNCEVSERQAQRYMRAAGGKPITARSIKCDTVSDLPRRVCAFEPVPDCVLTAIIGQKFFAIEQSTVTDHYFVSMLEAIDTDDAVAQWMSKPIRGDYVELPLAAMGLGEPSSIPWRIGRGCRVVAALGAPA